MKGNFHVSFLGEGAIAMSFPYPTQSFEADQTSNVRTRQTRLTQSASFIYELS
jgi:hypothetical protein